MDQLSLTGLFGLGLGTIIRHTAAAITVVVAIVFVGGTFIGQLDLAIRPYLPLYIVSHSLGATGPACLPGMASWLSPWSGLGMLAGYAAIAMLLGGLILARRDA
jgi:ABC-2 type transport system permease protein